MLFDFQLKPLRRQMQKNLEGWQKPPVGYEQASMILKITTQLELLDTLRRDYLTSDDRMRLWQLDSLREATQESLESWQARPVSSEQASTVLRITAQIEFLNTMRWGYFRDEITDDDPLFTGR